MEVSTHGNAVDPDPNTVDRIEVDESYPTMTRKIKFGENEYFKLVSSYIDGVERARSRLDPDTRILSKVQYTHCTKRKSEVYNFF